MESTHYWLAIAGLVLGVALILLSCIDIKRGLLPDSITLPLAWLGLLFNLDGLITPLPDAVVGAVAGYMFLWATNYTYRRIRGEDGLGFGDFKLTAALGAWFGWMALPWIVLGACVVAAGGAMVHHVRHGVVVPLPFGPYLAAAGLVAMLLVFSR